MRRIQSKRKVNTMPEVEEKVTAKESSAEAKQATAEAKARKEMLATEEHFHATKHDGASSGAALDYERAQMGSGVAWDPHKES